MDRSHARKLFLVMTHAWPNAPHVRNDGTTSVWLDMLDVLDLTAADEAVQRCISTCRTWPSLAEFRDVYADIMRRRRDEQPRALEAAVDIERTAAEVKALRRAMTENFRPVTARDLDAAGIPDWRIRLARARAASPHQYDSVWASIRADLRDRTGR